jgi:predicted dehydrogenase
MKTSPSQIPVAIVGLGRAGWSLHLQPLLAHPGFKIVAVADPVPDRCQEAAGLTGCQSFPSIDELLDQAPAEIVVVATPSFSHYHDAVKVFNAHRHCILEKPMALAFDDASRLLTLARQSNRLLFVHHNYLHGAEYHHLQTVLAGNRLGPLFHLRAFWAHYRRRWDWQTLKKNGGGALNNFGTHVLSIVLPLLGAPVSTAQAMCKNVKDAGDAEDHVQLLLQAANGVTADVMVSTAIALDAPRWMLCGRNGTLVSDGQKSRLRYYDPAKAPPRVVLDSAAPGRQYQNETLPWEEMEIPIGSSPVSTFHENVHEVLADRAVQIVTPESALEVVRVLEMARLSRLDAAGTSPRAGPVA